MHGVLHLCGYDHETDDGEMLALQRRVLAGLARDALRLRGARRPPQRRQVDAGQPDRGRQGGDRLRQAADHAPRDPRHRDRATTGSSCWSTCPASSARATRSPSACSAGWSARWPTPTPCCSCSTASSEVGAGDRFIAARDRAAPACRRSPREQGRPARPRAHGRRRSTAAAELGAADGEIFPISARNGRRRARSSSSTLVALLPEGPFLYPPDDHTDQPEAGAHRRAGARAGAAAHARGAAARGRGRDRRRSRSARTACCGARPACGPRPSRRRPSWSAPAGGWSRRSAPPRGARSSGARPRACTSTCTCACASGWRRDEALLDRLGIE